ACVIGREVPVPLLEVTIGQDPTSPLSELMRRDILVEAAGNSLRFTHDKLREAAYERIDETSRKDLHRLVAMGIEQQFPDEEYLAVLADHWEKAGEAAKASPCLLAAARRSKSRFLLDEASSLYVRYLN